MKDYTLDFLQAMYPGSPGQAARSSLRRDCVMSADESYAAIGLTKEMGERVRMEIANPKYGYEPLEFKKFENLTSDYFKRKVKLPTALFAENMIALRMEGSDVQIGWGFSPERAKYIIKIIESFGYQEARIWIPMVGAPLLFVLGDFRALILLAPRSIDDMKELPKEVLEDEKEIKK